MVGGGHFPLVFPSQDMPLAIYMIAKPSLTESNYRYTNTVCVAEMYSHIIAFAK